MKIVLLTHGTRGDVQPFVALATELIARGHAVRLYAPEDLGDFVVASGVPFAPAAANTRALLESEPGRRWLRSGSMRAFFATMGRVMYERRHELHRRMISACEGAEAIIAHGIVQDWAACIAEKQRVPLMLCHTCPVLPTGDFASPLLVPGSMPLRGLRRWSYSVYDHMAWGSKRATIDALRLDLGLPPASGSMLMRLGSTETPVLHMWSARVLPKPSDWRPMDVVTGYWRLPGAIRAKIGEGTRPAPLAEWLDRGPAPFFIGFGSTSPAFEPAAVIDLAGRVARRLGVRVVLGMGQPATPGGLQSFPEHLFFADLVDHTWLFSRCAGVVHHGGSGTTAAGLEAGAPTLICSLVNDQPFWGRRITELGVGAHIPFRSLDEKTLSRGIRRLQRDDVRRRAELLGGALRSEDGLGCAVAAVEERLRSAPVPR